MIVFSFLNDWQSAIDFWATKEGLQSIKVAIVNKIYISLLSHCHNHGRWG
jgi:hypothetical protein